MINDMCLKEMFDETISGCESIHGGPTRKLHNGNTANLPETPTEMNDLLTRSTHLTEKYFSYINRWFVDSNLYKIIFCTTQPIHLVVALLTTSIAYALYAPTVPQRFSTIATFLYLCSFTLHTGAQFWMTFVSGLSLYFSLPRHHFGTVQRILFPKYFMLNATASFITLTLYLRVKRYDVSWGFDTVLQAYVLASCFLVEFLIRIYLTPPLIELMQQKNDLEAQAGSGWEIGSYKLGTLALCPKYTTIHKEFRKVHMTVAFGNIYTLACTVLHMYYLSTKIII